MSYFQSVTRLVASWALCDMSQTRGPLPSSHLCTDKQGEPAEQGVPVGSGEACLVTCKPAAALPHKLCRQRAPRPGCPPLVQHLPPHSCSTREEGSPASKATEVHAPRQREGYSEPLWAEGHARHSNKRAQVKVVLVLVHHLLYFFIFFLLFSHQHRKYAFSYGTCCISVCARKCFKAQLCASPLLSLKQSQENQPRNPEFVKPYGFRWQDHSLN